MTAAVIYSADDILKHRIEWIYRLKSDKYTQHTFALATVLGYDEDTDRQQVGLCCIGVAVAGAHDWKWDSAADEESNVIILTDDQSFHYDYFRAYMGVPRKTLRPVDANGKVTKDFLDHLVHMNDNRKRDFKFIARFLEIAWGITTVS